MEEIDYTWQYLKDEEISEIEDIHVQSSYRRKINRTVKYIINPLYMYAIKNGFDDTEFLKMKTIHEMVESLKAYFQSRNMGREEEIEIILNSRRKK